MLYFEKLYVRHSITGGKPEALAKMFGALFEVARTLMRAVPRLVVGCFRIIRIFEPVHLSNLDGDASKTGTIGTTP